MRLDSVTPYGVSDLVRAKPTVSIYGNHGACDVYVKDEYGPRGTLIASFRGATRWPRALLYAWLYRSRSL